MICRGGPGGQRAPVSQREVHPSQARGVGPRGVLVAVPRDDHTSKKTSWPTHGRYKYVLYFLLHNVPNSTAGT